MADAEAQPISPFRPQSVKNATVEIRNGFVRKVYGILSAQLILTVAVAAPFQLVPLTWIQNNLWLLYVSVAVTICTICAMSCCSNLTRKYPTNYLFLFVFTLFQGVLVGFASAAYTWQSVLLAAGITAGVFVMLTIYAWNTSEDFTGMGPYLFGALCSLCLFGFTISILALCGVQVKALTMVYNAIGVLIFVFYIIFDTQMILGAAGGHKYEFSIDDYVFAALNLYLDIINLFIYILSLVGERR